MRFQITLERNGRPVRHEWKLDLRPDPQDLFVGRLWAQRKLDYWRVLESLKQPANDNLVAQIVALSQEWTLLSPHTAFLVLEKEADYATYGITRQLRHKYWKPEDSVTAQPLPPHVLAQLRQPRGRRAVVTEVDRQKALNMLECFVDLKPAEQWRKGVSKEQLLDEMDRALDALPKVPECCGVIGCEDLDEFVAYADPAHRDAIAAAGELSSAAISMFGGTDAAALDDADPVRATALRRLAGMGVDVPPHEWRELIDKDDVVLLDNRNSFEYRLGRFRNAIDPPQQREQGEGQGQGLVGRPCQPDRPQEVAKHAGEALARCSRGDGALPRATGGHWRALGKRRTVNAWGIIGAT